MAEQEKHAAHELSQSHEPNEVRGHAGQHEHTRAVINRLSRAIGHLGAIKKMVEEGRDCGEVLVQLSAVKAQIAGVSKVILKDHLDHCIADAVRDGDEQTIQSLKAAIDKLL